MNPARTAAVGVLLGVLTTAAPLATATARRDTHAGRSSATVKIEAQTSPTNPRCLVWRDGGLGETAGYSRATHTYVSHGDRGNQVKEIQCLLDWWGYNPGAMDGIFGHHTEQAVELFQYDRDLDVDAVVGPTTWAALRDQ